MASWQESTGKTIDQTFDQYIKDNPEVYMHFVQFALQWLKTGAKKISSKHIIGRIRWFVEVETKGESAREFKCNDLITSRIARKFIEEYPEYSERISFRRLRSA